MTVGVPIAAEEEQGLLAQAQPIGGATAAQGNDAGGAWAGPGGEQRTSGAASPHAFVAPFSPSKQHQPTKREQYTRYWMAYAYFGLIFINGALLVITSLSMSSFAKMLDKEVSAMSNLWIAKAIGTTLGSLVSSGLYKHNTSQYIHSFMALTTLSISSALIAIPMSVVRINMFSLSFFYGLIGLCVSINDVGVCVHSRKMHGDYAGMWLSCNTIFFGIGCEYVAGMQYFITDQTVFWTTGAIGYVVAVAVAIAAYLPSPEPLILSEPLSKASESQRMRKSSPPLQPRWFGGLTVKMPEYMAQSCPTCLRDLFPYYFETLFGCALFCVFGCKVAASAYLGPYLIQQLDYDPDSDMKFYYTYEFLILLIWTAALFARILGVMDQITVKPFKRVGPIINRATISMILSCFAVFLLDCNVHSFKLFWTAIIGYFFVAGPTLGYTYDANHRITVPNPTGTAILKFGFGIGASVVPFTTAKLWDYHGPGAFRAVLLACAIIPCCIYQVVRRDVELLDRDAAKGTWRFLTCL
eukprot:CAMPEP_0119504108 /NCGR_PEP_ID=MMETSP1344-20130328/25062_1 /TAXON_ID=236787 /ORGANISM="Florenciella parvula, Strain CCMP2471" /LENGTH=524 /DNA_ID=CAMNT_0007540449 /DNA_START=131 /DNA_END=1705 /DNA_ORIENTATION=-